MKTQFISFSWFLGALLGLFSALGGLFPCSARAAEPLQAVIFGGGPDVDNNALQIESHTRFVIDLLPQGTHRMVFFADGSPTNATVSYIDWDKLTDAQKALDALFPENNIAASQNRPPKLGAHLDGPSSRASLHRAVTKIASSAQTAPILFYFAGHGAQSGKSDSTTQYDMWNEEELTVQELSQELARLPSKAPILLVMAQCYSGAFANVIFREGNPQSPLIAQDLVGFFSSTKDHEAAGCGLGTDASEYQDFSSYFFGALSGHDRLGNRITGADFDGDGRVSFHEAYCYALINDPTMDTPTCTSDAFLARYAPVANSRIYGTSYEQLLQMASPAQRAALESLSAKLNLSGTDRVVQAHDLLTYEDPVGTPEQVRAYREKQDRLGALRKKGLDVMLAQWPDLRWSTEQKYQKALEQALKKAADDPAFCKELIEAKSQFEDVEDALEVQAALLTRFTHLAESIVRADRIRKSKNAAVKARFEQLWNSEQRSLDLAPGGNQLRSE